MSAEAKVAELNLQLPPIPKPGGVYKPVVIVGNMAYVSGHVSLKPDGSIITGRVGSEVDQEFGKKAAEAAGLAILTTLRAQPGQPRPRQARREDAGHGQLDRRVHQSPGSDQRLQRAVGQGVGDRERRRRPQRRRHGLAAAEFDRRGRSDLRAGLVVRSGPSLCRLLRREMHAGLRSRSSRDLRRGAGQTPTPARAQSGRPDAKPRAKLPTAISSTSSIAITAGLVHYGRVRHSATTATADRFARALAIGMCRMFRLAPAMPADCLREPAPRSARLPADDGGELR